MLFGHAVDRLCGCFPWSASEEVYIVREGDTIHEGYKFVTLVSQKHKIVGASFYLPLEKIVVLGRAEKIIL